MALEYVGRLILTSIIALIIGYFALSVIPPLIQIIKSVLERMVYKNVYEIEAVKKLAKRDDIDLEDAVAKHRKLIIVPKRESTSAIAKLKATKDKGKGKKEE